MNSEGPEGRHNLPCVGPRGLWADGDQKPVVDTTGMGCFGPLGLESGKEDVSVSI
jgi:hypothetical protein